jgi:predicted Zn finger-like uncharacterized protein
MSLATTCPQCRTSFKVVPDQLKLRRGLVRCGICRHVFSGVDYLKYLEDHPDAERAVASLAPAAVSGSAPPAGSPPLTASPPPAASPWLADPAARAQPDIEGRPGEHRGETFERSDREPFDQELDRVLTTRESVDLDPADHPRLDRDASAERESVAGDPFDAEPVLGEPIDHQLGSPQLGDRELDDHELGDLEFVDRETDGHASPDTEIGAPGSTFGAPAIDDDLFRDSRPDAPPPDAIATTDGSAARRAGAVGETQAMGSPDDDAVDFFSTNERSGGFATRASVFAAMASFVLGIALAVQLAIAARDWLAAALPVLRPALVAAATPLGLSVQPPRQLGALTIESFELQSAGDGGLLSMSALLRNAVDHPVRWPAMELSLTDGSGAVVVRKVLQPADYLAGTSRSETDGVAANAEWPLRVALEAQGVEPTAYSVKLFYP